MSRSTCGTIYLPNSGLPCLLYTIHRNLLTTTGERDEKMMEKMVEDDGERCHGCLVFFLQGEMSNSVTQSTILYSAALAKPT